MTETQGGQLSRHRRPVDVVGRRVRQEGVDDTDPIEEAETNAAVGGLEPPPAGRFRRAYLHRPHSTKSRSSTYIKLPSSIGTHRSV
jgi:hypothetical protein